MVAERTLRRKLQKKSKRLRNRRCSKCGGHAWTEPVREGQGRIRKQCNNPACRHLEFRFWPHDEPPEPREPRPPVNLDGLCSPDPPVENKPIPIKQLFYGIVGEQEKTTVTIQPDALTVSFGEVKDPLVSFGPVPDEEWEKETLPPGIPLPIAPKDFQYPQVDFDLLNLPTIEVEARYEPGAYDMLRRLIDSTPVVLDPRAFIKGPTLDGPPKTTEIGRLDG